MTASNTDFLTFGGGLSKYRIAARRLGRQAETSGLFATVRVCGPRDLDRTFRVRHSGILRSDVRGFGFFIWKPHLIERALHDSTSEFVLYCDAGCTLNLENPRALSRLSEYKQIASEHSVCSFFMPPHAEGQWTKRDLLNYFMVEAGEESIGQRVATVVLFKRSEQALEIVHEWSRIAALDNYHYLDDSPSVVSESDDFVEHRHDQSILSCLLKSKGVPSIADETYSSPDWYEAGAAFPIWATRYFRHGTFGKPRTLPVRVIERAMNGSERRLRSIFRTGDWRRHQPNS